MLGVAMTFSLVFSVGRYGRALLLKPLLDDVLLPAQQGQGPQFDLADLTMISPSGPTVLQWIVVASLTIVFVMPVASFVKTYLQQYALGSISMDMKKTIAGKLLRLPLAYHHGTHPAATS